MRRAIEMWLLRALEYEYSPTQFAIYREDQDGHEQVIQADAMSACGGWLPVVLLYVAAGFTWVALKRVCKFTVVLPEVRL